MNKLFFKSTFEWTLFVFNINDSDISSSSIHFCWSAAEKNCVSCSGSGGVRKNYIWNTRHPLLFCWMHLLIKSKFSLNSLASSFELTNIRKNLKIHFSNFVFKFFRTFVIIHVFFRILTQVEKCSSCPRTCITFSSVYSFQYLEKTSWVLDITERECYWTVYNRVISLRECDIVDFNFPRQIKQLVRTLC